MATQLLATRPTRRRLLRGAAGASLALVTAPAPLRYAAAQSWGSDPFSLGVASGAPRDDGFVLWTRLAPDPLSVDPATPGGMRGSDTRVSYEIASLIGHSGSSAFRPTTTTAVDVAHGLVLLFGIGTRPFHHGSRRRGGTIYRAALL